MMVRSYVPEDYETANRFWRARHGELGDLPAGMLPPLGVVVECPTGPLFFLWAYECFGVGVCFIEYPISDPLNSWELSRECFRFALRSIIALAGKACIPPGDYRVFRAMPSATLFRAMSGMGFEREYPSETHVPVIFVREGGE
jgi:hypothetical protein